MPGSGNGVEWTLRSPIGQLLVSAVTVDDGLGSRTTSLYRYVDGYYDGYAREFRGFARAFRFDQGDAFSESWRLERAVGDGQPWLVAGIRQN